MRELVRGAWSRLFERAAVDRARRGVRSDLTRDTVRAVHRGHSVPDPRIVVTWLLALAVPVATVVILAGLMSFVPIEVQIEVVRAHFAAIVGLPTAAMFSAFLVVVLQQTSGPVKFEGLGFRFEGTSGQVVLWVLCFLAIAAAIKLLW